MKWYSRNPFLIKLFHWEYWPFAVVYFPVFFYWIWLSLKARSFFFFNAANPTIINGGYLMESKFDIYKQIPSSYCPKTILVRTGTSFDDIKKWIVDAQFVLPLIAKPDIGMKGKGVKKITNVKQLEQYALKSKVDFLVQELISYENEAGIFYCRFPNQTKGFVSGIVLKEFLSVAGNGNSTIRQLIMQDERSLLQLKPLMKEYKDELELVLPEGQIKLLVPYGNHARGAKFIDASHLADQQLTDTMDAICRQIKGFYFGRLDIRYPSWEELKKGTFSIVELNGSGSEPTHIYDPKHSIWFAWKEIARHLKLLYTISKINHEQLNFPYITFTEGLQLLAEHIKYQRKLE